MNQPQHPLDEPPRTLDQQWREYQRNRFLAMPLAGTLMWTVVGVCGLLFPPTVTVWVLFIATGSIAYLGMGLSKLTGEDFLDKTKPKNAFDGLFMYTVVQAVAVYAIAIPFFIVDWSSLPLTVGILTGLMWIPLSWTLQHWIGLFHGLGRTVLILAAWYLFPEYRFVVIPAIIVAMYAVTITVLETRWRRFSAET